MPIKPVTGKIEAQTINDNLSYLESVFKNVDKGSPKGVYSTLSNLQAAFPTGNSNIYVISADGKWYYWNGTSWVSGGVYQSTGIADNSVTNEKIKYINADKINYNLLVDPYFSKVIAEDSDYLTKFEVDVNGNLKNKATSASLYEFNSVAITYPSEFEFSFTITVDKTTENGQLNGFGNTGNTNRYLFGYEPAHNAFEIYKGGFKVLDNDTNFSNGDYTFTFIYKNNVPTLNIVGPSYNKTFNVNDYYTFDVGLYNAFRFQFKIPSLGNALKNLTFKEYDKIEVDTSGLKTYSDKGKMSGRNVHVYRFGGKGNDWCFVRTPPTYDPNGKPHPFVIANHGNGWVMDGTTQKANWTKRTMYVNSSDPDYIADPTQYNLVPSGQPELLYSNPTIEALLNAGYIVCGAQNYDDNLYGNNNCRNAMQNFYFHMTENYNVEKKCFMIGASNGAMTSLNGMYLLNGVERVKAMILQYPLTCLWRQYNNYPSHQGPIESAYGINPGLTEEQFNSATRTHDPEKVNTIISGTERVKTTALPPIKFYYSFGDPVTHPNNNSLPLMQVLEDSNLIYEGVEASGSHGDYSHFDPSAYVSWFEKYR